MSPGLALQVNSQQCNNNGQCRSDCVATAPNNNCCVLNPNETVSQDLNSATPLGFILYTLPGTETGMSPPCMLVPFPESAIGQAGVYLVLAVSKSVLI